MKKLFLSLVALVCAMVSFAQSQIATLSHGDEIKTFYGSSGFGSAMNAAEHGDIVTLSSGHFSSTNITKAVTLRGAGMVEITDSVGFHAPTIIDGSITIQIPDSIESMLTIDGMKFGGGISVQSTLKNPIFTKCNISSFRSYSSETIIKNAIFINCRVTYSLVIRDNSTVTCINSIIANPYCENANIDNTFEFNNCMLMDVNYPGYLAYSTFKNCYIIFSSSYSSYSFPASCIINNCYSSNANAFTSTLNPTNKHVAESDMFASYGGGDWGDSEKFLLKDDAATKYLGDDDTQMGIYGGNMPYEERISMPQITKCNVAGKSTADGKLSVDIQVEAAQ